MLFFQYLEFIGQHNITRYLWNVKIKHNKNCNSFHHHFLFNSIHILITCIISIPLFFSKTVVVESASSCQGHLPALLPVHNWSNRVKVVASFNLHPQCMWNIKNLVKEQQQMFIVHSINKVWADLRESHLLLWLMDASRQSDSIIHSHLLSRYYFTLSDVFLL